MTETFIKWHLIPTLEGIVQYNDIECTLARCIFHNAVKHKCNHFDAVSRIEIPLKTRRYAIPAPRFVVERVIEGVI